MICKTICKEYDTIKGFIYKQLIGLINKINKYLEFKIKKIQENTWLLKHKNVNFGIDSSIQTKFTYTRYLECGIEPGMFDSESIATFSTFNGISTSIFVDKRLIIDDIINDNFTTYLKVEELISDGCFSVIRLPVESNNLGSVIKVGINQLKPFKD